METAFHDILRDADGPASIFLCENNALAKIGLGSGHNLIGTANVGAAVGLANSLQTRQEQ